MAVVVTAMLTLASQLYTTSRDSSHLYEDAQTCRAVAEMACYQYILDLCSVTVTKDLDAEWISMGESAMYSQALDTIVDAIGGEEDPKVWHVTSAETALSAVNVSNSAVLVPLLGAITNARQELRVEIQYPLALDWASSDSWTDRDSALAKVEPFYVDVFFSLKGEEVTDRFYIDNLYLSTEDSSLEVGEGVEHSTVVFALQEGEEGVTITREELSSNTEE